MMQALKAEAGTSPDTADAAATPCQAFLATFRSGRFVFSVEGNCCICNWKTEFRAERDTEISPAWYKNWFRSGLKCMRCGSVPRERALFSAIERFYPAWRTLRIHESSPVRRGATLRLQDECPGYVQSQYDPSLPPGALHTSKRYRNEDLEAQSFEVGSFDLVITQDVYEHLFAPDKAIRETERTLAPGGAHVMTVPIVRGAEPSVRRARLENGRIRHILPPQYHGNPMSGDGSLVTIDWGYDIIDYLAFHSGLAVCCIQTDDLSQGISAVYTDVLLCKKIQRVDL